MTWYMQSLFYFPHSYRTEASKWVVGLFEGTAYKILKRLHTMAERETKRPVAAVPFYNDFQPGRVLIINHKDLTLSLCEALTSNLSHFKQITH